MSQRTFISLMTGALVCLPVLAFAQTGTAVQPATNTGIVPPAATQSAEPQLVVETKGSEKAVESKAKAQGDAHKAEQGKTEAEKCKNMTAEEKVAAHCPAVGKADQKDEKAKEPKAGY